MKIIKTFLATISPNTSPVTYIVFGGLIARTGALFLEEGWVGLESIIFIITMLAAAVTICGFVRESKPLVSWGTMVGFTCELYIVWQNFLGGDAFRSVAVSTMFLVVLAYVYWTNSLDRLWSYTPGIERD